jgi:hypothetical protein
MAINEIDRYAIGVELRLPGPDRPAIHFTGARVVRYPSELAFLLLARNTGNVILTNVQGRVVVSDAGGVVVSKRLGPGTFVTRTAIAYPVGAPDVKPAEGTRYRVQATLSYAGGIARLDRWVTFGRAASAVQQRYAPARASSEGQGQQTLAWLIVGGAVAALLLAGALVAIAYRRRRTRRGGAAFTHLRRALAAANGAQPVSVMRIEVEPEGRRRALRVVARHVRAADRLCDLGAQGVLLVLPATAATTAAVLALDAARSWPGRGSCSHPARCPSRRRPRRRRSAS